MRDHPLSRTLAVLVLALLLGPAQAAQRPGPLPYPDVTTELRLRLAGTVHYTPSEQCRLKGAVEEDVVFLGGPLHAVSHVDFDPTGVHVAIHVKLDNLGGTGQTTGGRYRLRGGFRHRALPFPDVEPYRLLFQTPFTLVPPPPLHGSCKMSQGVSVHLNFHADGVLLGTSSVFFPDLNP